MISRLLNWIPVLFGLKFAGVASVATVQDVVAGEVKTPITTSKTADVSHSSENRHRSERIASGSAVTRLMATTSIAPVLSDSFVFADLSEDATDAEEAADTRDDTNSITKTIAEADASAEQAAPAEPQSRFVARPIAVAPPRPKARIAEAKAAKAARMGKETIKRQPGQIKQQNRPTARAKLKVEGKKVAKRVVWIAGRASVTETNDNVIAFPAPARDIRLDVRHAA